jgi:hypothetical protein
MDSEALSKRRKELEARADQEKLDWKDRIKGLKDDRVVVLALGTLLGFNLRDTLNPSKSIADLDRQRKEVEAAKGYLAALRHAAGR